MEEMRSRGRWFVRRDGKKYMRVKNEDEREVRRQACSKMAWTPARACSGSEGERLRERKKVVVVLVLVSVEVVLHELSVERASLQERREQAGGGFAPRGQT